MEDDVIDQTAPGYLELVRRLECVALPGIVPLVVAVVAPASA